MMGPDGQFEPVDYIQSSGGAAEGNYVSFLVPDMSKVPTAQAFAKAFQAKYGVGQLVWAACLRSGEHPAHRDQEGGQAGPRGDP